jgi:protein O-GlcNAc transferase
MPSDDESALSCWEAGAEAVSRSDWPAAAHAYREATRIDPGFGEAYVGLGAALGNQGFWADCATAHRRALELLPGDREATYNLGVALAELNDFAGAEQCFRAIEASGPDAEISMRLGWALAEQSKCAAALSVFESILDRDPQNAEAHAMAARELFHFGRLQEARVALERVRSLRPQLFEDWEELKALWLKVAAG